MLGVFENLIGRVLDGRVDGGALIFLDCELELDNNIVDWQESHTQALMTASNEAELFAALVKVAGELGFDYCAYGLRAPLPISNPKMFLLNNYPNAWRERYAQAGYLAVDPTVAHGIKSVLPVVWSDRVFQSCPELWEEARGHGLNAGWAQSSYDAKGAVGMLTLARSNEAITGSELRHNSMRMSWLVQAVHAAVTRLSPLSSAQDAAVSLTAREVEVLRWTADGKTSNEVGQIMNISERTVNFHVNNCLEKLGVTNKTAGVIKAAMLRML